MVFDLISRVAYDQLRHLNVSRQLFAPPCRVSAAQFVRIALPVASRLLGLQKHGRAGIFSALANILVCNGLKLDELHDGYAGT